MLAQPRRRPLEALVGPAARAALEQSYAVAITPEATTRSKYAKSMIATVESFTEETRSRESATAASTMAIQSSGDSSAAITTPWKPPLVHAGKGAKPVRQYEGALHSEEYPSRGAKRPPRLRRRCGDEGRWRSLQHVDFSFQLTDARFLGGVRRGGCGALRAVSSITGQHRSAGLAQVSDLTRPFSVGLTMVMRISAKSLRTANLSA